MPDDLSCLLQYLISSPERHCRVRSHGVLLAKSHRNKTENNLLKKTWATCLTKGRPGVAQPHKKTETWCDVWMVNLSWEKRWSYTASSREVYIEGATPKTGVVLQVKATDMSLNSALCRSIILFSICLFLTHYLVCISVYISSMTFFPHSEWMFSKFSFTCNQTVFC